MMLTHLTLKQNYTLKNNNMGRNPSGNGQGGCLIITIAIIGVAIAACVAGCSKI